MVKNEGYYKGLFLTAAFYDFILGILFLFFFSPIYNYFGIAIPDNSMYLQLSAAFVIAMGIGYFFVYQNLKNRDLVKLGVVYKLVYSALAIYYFSIGLAHWIFFLFAILDLIFLVLFVHFIVNSKK